MTRQYLGSTVTNKVTLEVQVAKTDEELHLSGEVNDGVVGEEVTRQVQPFQGGQVLHVGRHVADTLVTDPVVRDPQVSQRQTHEELTEHCRSPVTKMTVGEVHVRQQRGLHQEPLKTLHASTTYGVVT